MGFFKKAIDFISRPTQSRTMGILIFFVLIAALSLTVIVAQQQQNLKQRAAGDACDYISTIADCPTTATPGSACSAKGAWCKIGPTVYECKQQ